MRDVNKADRRGGEGGREKESAGKRADSAEARNRKTNRLLEK